MNWNDVECFAHTGVNTPVTMSPSSWSTDVEVRGPDSSATNWCPGTTTAEVQGLNAFPKDQWPTNIPLLYFSYHVMVGLGTIFVGVMALAVFLLWRRKLYTSPWMLWIILLCVPFPYIANTAGWLTAEVGRQPWLVYGLLRTNQGYSTNVIAGNSMFTLLGYMGLYLVLGILFLFLIQREIGEGPALAAAGTVRSGAPITTT